MSSTFAIPLMIETREMWIVLKERMRQRASVSGGRGRFQKLGKLAGGKDVCPIIVCPIFWSVRQAYGLHITSCRRTVSALVRE